MNYVTIYVFLKNYLMLTGVRITNPALETPKFLIQELIKLRKYRGYRVPFLTYVNRVVYLYISNNNVMLVALLAVVSRACAPFSGKLGMGNICLMHTFKSVKETFYACNMALLYVTDDLCMTSNLNDQSMRGDRCEC
jgi:hypothetical protein